MYKCLDCGHIFDDGEQKIIGENHGLPGARFAAVIMTKPYNAKFVAVSFWRANLSAVATAGNV